MTRKKAVLIKLAGNHTVFHYLLTVGEYSFKGLLDGVLWFAVAYGGFLIFQSKITPYDIILGLPLCLAGVGFVINYLYSAVLSIFSLGYNRGVCRWCD